MEPKMETRGGEFSPNKQMQIFLRFLSVTRCIFKCQIGIGKEEVHKLNDMKEKWYLIKCIKVVV